MNGIDPTTAAIERDIAERQDLRDRVAHLEREVSRLRKISDEAERAHDKGYDQAVRDIRDHFKKQNSGVATTIENLWLKDRS